MKDQDILQPYPLLVQEQLGQMMAAVTLLSATIKINGSITLQVDVEKILSEQMTVQPSTTTH